MILYNKILNRHCPCAVLIRNAVEINDHPGSDDLEEKSERAKRKKEIIDLQSTNPHNEHRAKWVDFAARLIGDMDWLLLS